MEIITAFAVKTIIMIAVIEMIMIVAAAIRTIAAVAAAIRAVTTAAAIRAAATAAAAIRAAAIGAAAIREAMTADVMTDRADLSRVLCFREVLPAAAESRDRYGAGWQWQSDWQKKRCRTERSCGFFME